MFLIKRPNGIYHLVYFDKNKKRCTVSTKVKLKSEANKFLVDYSAKLKEEEEQRARNKFVPINLQAFISLYLKRSEVIHTAWTNYSYKQTFKFFMEYIGDKPLSEIYTKDINNYVEYRIKKGSVYQARKDLINIAAAFNWAIAQDYLIKSPCEKVKKVKVPQKLPLFYTQDDFKKLIEVIDSEDIRDLVIFAVNTGLRQMELLKLKWSQINFTEKIVILDNHHHLTKGKKIRTIPLNANAFSVVEKRAVKKEAKEVFTYKGMPMEQKFISPKFAEYVVRAEINEKLNFHSLRHTFASWLVQKGVSIYKVSKLLGHSETKTTEIYSHLRAEDLRDSTDLLNS